MSDAALCAHYGSTTADATGRLNSRVIADRAQPPLKQSRYLLLIICMLTVGSHFGRHFLSSLSPLIIQKLAISRSQYGLLFSGQELPSVILPLASGFFISALGLHYGPVTLVLAGFVAVGQIMTASAVQHRSYSALIIGRLLFGVSDGALVVVQGAIVGKCYGRGKISTAFGATLLFSRLGSCSGFIAPGFLAERFGVEAAMWVSASVCIVGMFSALAYFFMERRNDRYREDMLSTGTISGSSQQQGPIRTLLLHAPEFWTLVYVWSAVASSVFTLLHFCADIASTELHLKHAASRVGLVSGMLLLFSGLASPLVGWLQDHVGHRIQLLSGALAMCAIGILCGLFSLMSSDWLVVPAFGFIAVGFAVAPVTLLSCVALVVSHESLPAALGFYKGTENLALAITHWVAGTVRDLSATYIPTLFILAGLAASGSLAALILRSVAAAEVLERAAMADCFDEIPACDFLEEAVAHDMLEEAL